MAQVCTRCSRLNPPAATFCYFDGTLLPGHAANGTITANQRFPNPFVFPTGRACGGYDELALCCQEHWAEAKDLLQKGYLENFLAGLGRADLAYAAREAAHFPDPDRGLDQFLGRLPTKALHPPKLKVDPLEINLGQIPLGEDHHLHLDLRNEGMRLLFGSVSCESCPWLSVGAAQGAKQKLFAFGNEMTIPVHVWGKHLWAGGKGIEGKLVVDSNGGIATVVVRAQVPAKPFAFGVLTGATTPRQIAEKARDAAKDAAVYFEKGLIAQWYKDNGWTYPVQGPPASGLGALQQFFEALGLTPPPKVDISEKSVTLQGNPGDKLEHSLVVKAEERRPVFAHAVSDQPWLEVGRARLSGRRAHIGLSVPSVPRCPGDTLQAKVTVTANGNQRFVIPVTLVVSSNVRVGVLQPVLVGETVEDKPISVLQFEESPKEGVEPPPVRVPPTEQPILDSPEIERKPRLWRHLIPAALLFLVLLGIVGRDFGLESKKDGVLSAEESLLDSEPRIRLGFHDGPKKDEYDVYLPKSTMRFGLVMLKERDPKDATKLKRLTYDEWGRTNNTCVRIDREDWIYGHEGDNFRRGGKWKERERQAPLSKDKTGRERTGFRSVMLDPSEHIQVTQTVEIIPGEQSRLLDTCLVLYGFENLDRAQHQVGIRFMLDTYIGANDGVPFTIPGENRLYDTMMDFPAGKIPDFLQALEKEDLEKPGTIAHVKLKLGGRIEPPSRVTLGAWPDIRFKDQVPAQFRTEAAQAHITGWNVPVAPMTLMKQYGAPDFHADSAVVIYWHEKPLQPGEKREVGFTYGLGSISSGEGKGKLGLTVGGSFIPGGEFTLTAYVRNPGKDETVTLTVPEGLQLSVGTGKQEVPPLPTNVATPNSPVSWKIKAGRAGKYNLKVQSSTGLAQSIAVTIRSSGIFD